jgi:SpoVK/Ycf46/Vps4 family AAA+-type ATPase
MPNSRRTTDLFAAIGRGDLHRAREVGLEICRDEERRGHRKAARSLRGILNPNSNRFSPDLVQTVSATPIAAGVLSRVQRMEKLADVVLPSKQSSLLSELCTEWKKRKLLAQHGIQPRRRVLFHGPPGCGKSLAATAIGNELGLPVFVARFDAIVGAYLGQTAANLRRVFLFAETTPCVLLLDEIDAVGKSRGNLQDVGELDRVVISLMQELEHSLPAGLVIATSNLPGHLDRALWRRFDLTVLLPAPARTVLREHSKRLARAHGVDPSPRLLAAAQRANNFAQLERIVQQEARRAVLDSEQS